MMGLTFVNDAQAKDLQWHVSEEFTYTNHQVIIFQTFLTNSKTINWLTNKFDGKIFKQVRWKTFYCREAQKINFQRLWQNRSGHAKPSWLVKGLYKNEISGGIQK